VPVASLSEKSYKVLGEANAQTPEVKEARRRKPAAATTGDGMFFNSTNLCVGYGCAWCVWWCVGGGVVVW